MAAHLIQYDEHRAETEIRLEALGAFIKEFRTLMVSKRDSEKAKIDDAFKKDALTNKYHSDEGLSAEQKQEELVMQTAFHYYHNHVVEYYGELPRTFNYSCLIQIYTLLEERGTLLCRDIREKNPDIPFSVEELRGQEDDINCIRLFLERQCKVELRDWSKIVTLRKLRNGIVHANGKIKPEKLDFFKSIKDIVVLPNLQLRVTNAYVDSIFETVRDLFISVFNQMKYPTTMKIARWPEYVAISINTQTRDVIIEED